MLSALPLQIKHVLDQGPASRRGAPLCLVESQTPQKPQTPPRTAPSEAGVLGASSVALQVIAGSSQRWTDSWQVECSKREAGKDKLLK